MNKVLPPLHAQMQFPDLNLEDRERVQTVNKPKIAMSPMKLYVLMCIYQSIQSWKYSQSAYSAYMALHVDGLISDSIITTKGMDYIKKLQEVQP